MIILIIISVLISIIGIICTIVRTCSQSKMAEELTKSNVLKEIELKQEALDEEKKTE